MNGLLERIINDDTSAHLPQTAFTGREQNLFSYWFPKLKDCGMRVPESLIFKTPEDLLNAGVFYMENQIEDSQKIREWVDKDIIPNLGKFTNALFFMKNGTFSGKFSASRCCFGNANTLASQIGNIMYDSLCVGAGGTEEVVIRERISYNQREIPCIYDGLPLRPEFRVFYDFDKKEVLYTANYWDYDYVRPNLYGKTDVIVFEYMRERLERAFEKYKAAVEAEVKRCMINVKGMTGAWSVDVMLYDYLSEPSDDEYISYMREHTKPEEAMYLIDMARAEHSAYWIGNMEG